MEVEGRIEESDMRREACRLCELRMSYGALKSSELEGFIFLLASMRSMVDLTWPAKKSALRRMFRRRLVLLSILSQGSGSAF